MTATEYVILVDEHDNEIGVGEKLAVHQQNQLHRAFSIFIFCQETGQILLQKRAFSKYHSAGLWTNTCCSHPRQGESIIEAGERRLQEELGIITSLKNIGLFHYNAHFENGLAENEMDHVLIGSIAAQVIITPHPAEIHATRWISLANLEIELAQNPEQFTPWLKPALEIVSRHTE